MTAPASCTVLRFSDTHCPDCDASVLRADVHVPTRALYVSGRGPVLRVHVEREAVALDDADAEHLLCTSTVRGGVVQMVVLADDEQLRAARTHLARQHAHRLHVCAGAPELAAASLRGLAAAGPAAP